MNYFFEVLKKYAVFDGRARRAEYWYFILFNMIFSLIIAFLQIMGYKLIGIVYGLGLLIPSLAVCVRRLHDVGKSGWMVLIALIPLVGPIWFLILMFTDSQIGDNEYGPNPKGIGPVSPAQAPIQA